MSKKITTEEFIIKARKIHGDKYNYKKVHYKNCDLDVIIGCPIDGKFLQTPYHHVSRKQGCPKCAIRNVSIKKRHTTDQFIAAAKKVHGKKYCYDKSNYVGNKTKLIIICNQCGCEFQQEPSNHLGGQGCPKCGFKSRINKRRSTKKYFIKKAREIHGRKYKYTKFNYVNGKTKSDIICNTCGWEFSQSPDSHLSGNGCPKCSGKLLTHLNCLATKKPELIKEWDYKKNNKLTPNDVTYKSHKEAWWLCKICNFSWETPVSHRSIGQGCPRCGRKSCADKLRFTKEEFINRAIKVHGNKFNYIKFDYKGCENTSVILCNKCKYEFLQTPYAHLMGAGCPRCNASKLENNVAKFLNQYNIVFEEQKKFQECKNKKPLPFDFYLPGQNVLIECQGEQHYKRVKHFYRTKSDFEERLKLDKIKKGWAINNSLMFIEFNEGNKHLIKDVIKNIKTIRNILQNQQEESRIFN